MKNERLGVHLHIGGNEVVKNKGNGVVGVVEALESGGVENR